jgi:hypothetical protein
MTPRTGSRRRGTTNGAEHLQGGTLAVGSHRVEPGRDAYEALARTTGAVGVAFVALLFGPTIAISSAGEPALEATGEQAATFFGNADATWVDLAQATSTLGLMGSLWFVVAFGFLLRRAEGDPAWRSAIATLSGAMLAAYGLIDTSWQAASLHGKAITPAVADYAFAVGNLGFANAWIPIASFAACTGWVILRTGLFERWMGWWVLTAGAGLVVARFVWTTQAWGAPYMAFWLWVLVVSVRLLRHPDRWR